MDKNKGMMIIIIVMLGLIIASIAAFTVLIFTGAFGTFLGNAAGVQQVTVVEHSPHAITEQDIRYFELSSDITTNLLSHEGGRHVVRVTVGIGINNLDESEASDFYYMLREREIVILDIATNILRRTTRDDLAVVGGTEVVAEEILTALQDAFGSQLIVRVRLGNLVTS